ncbi:hypothetical protein V8C86DRAFT_2457540 [Haematococcus lacustris]
MAVTDVRNDTLDCPWDVPAEPGSTTFRTGLFRLFQGRKGEYALSSCWWYMDSASGPVYGPFSCEQMLLACFANGLRRSTWVCGTTHELAPPLAPKASQFKPLHELIQWCSRESTASYTLITPKDVRVAG